MLVNNDNDVMFYNFEKSNKLRNWKCPLFSKILQKYVMERLSI